MVRIIGTFIVAAIAGVVLGRVHSAIADRGYEERFLSARVSDAELKGDVKAVEALTHSQGQPRVEVVGGADYNFGVMHRGETMSKEFIFRNIGDGPLSLNMGSSTCKCTIGEMDRNVLQPGEETVVKLTWTANAVAPDFGQSATIITNDPIKPEVKLTIHGRVVEAFVLQPEQLSLGTLSVAKPTHAKFYFFNYSDKQIAFENIGWTDETTRPFVRVTPQLIPLDPEKFPEHKAATSVHEFSLDIQPGLPVGPLASRIQIYTDLNLDDGPIEYHVTGNVVGDISLVGGASFNPKVNLLDIGTVDPQQGAEVTIFLNLRGDKRDANVSIDSVVPDEALDVLALVDQAKTIGDRRLVPIKFVVPKGAPPVYYPANARGKYGKVLLNIESDPPEKVTVFVRLNVPAKGKDVDQ